MIGAPTDFRHIEGAKIGASGRMEQVKADKDIRQNNDMKKLLMDMRLIDSEMEFNKILEDDNVKIRSMVILKKSVVLIEHDSRYANQRHNSHVYRWHRP